MEEEGGFKEERRLKGKGEEKEEEEEVIALGSVCSSSIPQLLSSALCALALSLVPPPIRDSPLFPRLQKGAPSLFCETRALLSKRGGGSKGGAELHLQERTLEEKRVEFVGEAAVAKIRVQRTLLPSAPSISIRSSPFLSPVAKQGEGEEWQQQGRSGRFRPVCAKKDPPLSSPHALVS